MVLWPCLTLLVIIATLSLLARRGIIRERKIARSMANHPAGKARV